ncbi:hypothetical protein D3C79_515800 [compost metagenome]
MTEMTFTKGRFNIDGGKIYKGFTAGHTWNGWQCPYFTEDVVKQIIEDMEQAESMEFYYNKKFDKYAVSFDEDDSNFETYSGMTINFKGEELKVYPLGNGSWCWDIIDSDLISALKCFASSARCISEAFECDKEMEDALNGELNKYYPFKESFEDIVGAIDDWSTAFEMYESGKTVEEIEDNI